MPQLTPRSLHGIALTMSRSSGRIVQTAWYEGDVGDSETTRGASLISEVGPTSWVLVAVGGGDLRAHALRPGLDFVIGRDLECDLPLDHHRVSRKHARLHVALAGDACTIEDLGSRNGTRINEVALAPNT